jgi:single-strand DNA-binding protein
MEIIGRLTANAKRKELSDGRNVVNFSIAINDSYKPKGATEAKKVTTFVDCAYWINPGIADHLKKGSIVQLSGSISARAYKNMDGEAKANLSFHVNTIKLHGGNPKNEVIHEPVPEHGPVEDLPF